MGRRRYSSAVSSRYSSPQRCGDCGRAGGGDCGGRRSVRLAGRSGVEPAAVFYLGSIGELRRSAGTLCRRLQCRRECALRGCRGAGRVAGRGGRESGVECGGWLRTVRRYWALRGECVGRPIPNYEHGTGHFWERPTRGLQRRCAARCRESPL